MSTARAQHVPGELGLLLKILEGRPNLQGALCSGKNRLFDAARFPEAGSDSTTARAHATTLCRSCPARGQCNDNLETR